MSDEGKLFIGGLSFDTTEESLGAAFSKYGSIEKVDVIKDKETGRSRGFGFVTYDNVEDARDALTGMNGKILDGRTIRVDEAGKGGGRSGGSGFRGGSRGGFRGRGGRGYDRSYGGGDRSYGGGDRGYGGGDRGYGGGDRGYGGGDRGYGGQERSYGGYRTGGGDGYRNNRNQGGYNDRSGGTYRDTYDSYVQND